MALSIADTRHNNSLLYAECRCAEWHVLFVVKLVIYAECRYAECCCAEFHYAECRSTPHTEVLATNKNFFVLKISAL